MATFDAPNREVCTVRRVRTNTPLQALVTLNDPVYLEAAGAFAKRMPLIKGSVADTAEYGLRLALIRPVRAGEIAPLMALQKDAQQAFEAAPGAGHRTASGRRDARRE